MTTRIKITLILLACLLASCAPAAQPTAQGGSPALDELIPLATAFVDQLSGGNFTAASARFDAAMKAALPEAKLKDLWAQLQTQLGAFQKQVGTRTAQSPSSA